MSFISIVLLGIGLSMDAFAVSIAKGMTIKRKDTFRYAWLLALFFGAFQALMPIIGWWAGSYFQELISNVDHWIAFGLLGLIGLNMIRESLHHKEESQDAAPLSISSIFVLAIATSIDALAVGISLAFLQVDILSAAAIIGITTFLLSFLAVYIGRRLGHLFEKYAELLGGMILICIGIKILIEHLCG